MSCTCILRVLEWAFGTSAPVIARKSDRAWLGTIYTYLPTSTYVLYSTVRVVTVYAYQTYRERSNIALDFPDPNGWGYGLHASKLIDSHLTRSLTGSLIRWLIYWRIADFMLESTKDGIILAPYRRGDIYAVLFHVRNAPKCSFCIYVRNMCAGVLPTYCTNIIIYVRSKHALFTSLLLPCTVLYVLYSVIVYYGHCMP